MVPENYGISTQTEKYDIFFRGNMKYINNKVLDNRIHDDLSLIYGACSLVKNQLKTDKSRTILLISSNNYLYKSVNMIYKNIDGIVSNLKYRTDIGSKFISKYEAAGISDNANESVANIKTSLKSTHKMKMYYELGDFGGIYNLDGHKLVSSVDGWAQKPIL